MSSMKKVKMKIKNEVPEFPRLPEGTYKATIKEINPISIVHPKYGKQDKLAFRFTVSAVRDEETMEFVPSLPLSDKGEPIVSVDKLTNQNYASPKGSLQPFLKSLLGGSRRADSFMETCGDTDAIIGWDGIITVTEETADNGTKYSNITFAEPSAKWLKSLPATLKNFAEKKPEENTSVNDEELSDPFSQ